jgi:hypothetical protein
LKNIFKIAVISWLISLPLFATPPDVGFDIDLSHPTVKFDYTTFAGNTPSFPVGILTNGLPYNGFTGYTPQFNYFPTDSSSAGKTISGTLSGSVATFVAVSNSFPVKGEFFAEVFFISGSSKITAGQGRLHVQRSPSGGSYGNLNLSPIINWDIVTNIGNFPWSSFDTNYLGAQITANWNSFVATSAVFQALFDAQKNTNSGFQASITNLNGYTNYAYLGWTWGNWSTNGLATTNQLNIVSNLLVTAQSDITNNLANQALSNAAFSVLHTAQGNTNAGFELRMGTVETGKMSLATQTSTNTLLQNQITANLTNQNATNTLLQNAIDAVGTGTWSLALLTDGSRPGAYLNIANTNYLGNELITNGTFTGSASNWSLTTFYYQGNRVILNPSLTGQLEYTNTLVVTTNKLYQLAVKTTYAGAAITGTVGGISYAWTSVDGETHNEYFYAVSDAKPIISAATGTNSLEIDDVSLMECPTGSVFAANFKAGNSVIARVGVYAPNITAISNDLDTVETTITLHTDQISAISNDLDTAESAIIGKLGLSGGIMTGPITNNVNYYGNGAGLTNVSASSTGLGWTAISGTPTTYGVGGYGITNLPVSVTDHTALTNQNGSNDFLHLTLAEKAIATNTEVTLERYFANTNAGQVCEVFATATGITASRTNEYFYVSIPANVRVFSMRMRVDGDYTAGGVIYLSMGTNDVNNNSVATMWIPSINCVREDSLANVVLTCRPDLVDATLLKIAGLGTTAGIIYQIHLGF